MAATRTGKLYPAAAPAQLGDHSTAKVVLGLLERVNRSQVAPVATVGRISGDARPLGSQSQIGGDDGEGRGLSVIMIEA